MAALAMNVANGILIKIIPAGILSGISTIRRGGSDGVLLITKRRGKFLPRNLAALLIVALMITFRAREYGFLHR